MFHRHSVDIMRKCHILDHLMNPVELDCFLFWISEYSTLLFGIRRWTLSASFLKLFYLFLSTDKLIDTDTNLETLHILKFHLFSSFQPVIQRIHQCHSCLVVVNFSWSLRHWYSQSNWNMFNIFWKVDYVVVKRVN